MKIVNEWKVHCSKLIWSPCGRSQLPPSASFKTLSVYGWMAHDIFILQSWRSIKWLRCHYIPAFGRMIEIRKSQWRRDEESFQRTSAGLCQRQSKLLEEFMLKWWHVMTIVRLFETYPHVPWSGGRTCLWLLFCRSTFAAWAHLKFALMAKWRTFYNTMPRNHLQWPQQTHRGYPKRHQRNRNIVEYVKHI